MLNDSSDDAGLVGTSLGESLTNETDGQHTGRCCTLTARRSVQRNKAHHYNSVRLLSLEHHKATSLQLVTNYKK